MSPVAGQLAGLRSLRARAPRIAVTGAKGGVGKTLVAVNLALLLAQKGYRTLLVDLDPGCGNVDVHLRLARANTLDDALLGQCEAVEAVVDGPHGLRVLGGRSGSLALADAGQQTVDAVFSVIERAAADVDVVVVDTGAGLGALSLAAAERADLVLSIATADPSALTDAYAQCKLLHQRGRPLPRLLVNGAPSREDAMRTATKFAAVCRRFLGSEAPFFGWLRRDAQLEKSSLEQRPVALGTPASSAAADELKALCAAALSALPTLPRRQARHAVLLRAAQ